MVPYSCWFLRMCWAYADWGVVISDVVDVFAVPLCPVSTSLPYIWHVACLAGKFIYPTFIVVWYFLGVVLGFDALLYCVCAFESDVYVCMFKEIGKLSDFWAVVCKCCHFLFSFFVVLVWALCCICVFSLAMCVFGKLLFCAMVCIASQTVSQIS